MPVSGVQTARFEISRQRGALSLRGHTVSSEHERQLLDIAEQSYPGARAIARFTSLDAAPGEWAATTLVLLEALRETRSAKAIMTEESLRIRGVGMDYWPRELERLRAALPNAFELDVDVLLPDPNLSVAELCASAVTSYKVSPVYFEESATTLRNSAHPVLEQTISLADACRDSTISITGHTDSSGYEPSNQQLSLARAGLVANYFVDRGIARERLAITGAGSSLPVADNGTRFGRSLNRRITIELQNGSSTEER